MKKTINEVRVIGRLYSFDLKEATVTNTSSTVFGKNYINGVVNIATDDKGLNIVPITYTFVTPETRGGKANLTYSVLKKIMSDENIKQASKDGMENATIVEASRAALAVDDRYSTVTNEFKTYTNNSGGFLTIRTPNDVPAEEDQRNYFDVDMLITQFKRVPEDPEKEIKEHGIVHGAIFGFNGNLLPIDFKVTSAGGMDYFEGLGVSSSNPVFTKVHGTVVNNRQVIQTEEKTAFGAPIITTNYKTTRDWIITSVIETPYDFGAEEVLTSEELTKKMQEREIHLATVKKDAEEYAANKKSDNPVSGGPTAGPVGAVPAGGFKF